MRLAFATLASVLMLSALTGCGSRLKSDKVRSLELGKTSERQVVAMFGKPKYTDSRNDGGRETRILRYDHVGGTAIAFYRIADVRYLVIELLNDRLHGYLFASTAGGDATKFNQSAVGSIQKGVTTKDDLLRLLGEPAGRALPGTPLPDYQGAFRPGVAEIWAWTMVEGANAMMWQDVTVRLLLVKLDASGRVVETATRAVQQKA